MPRRKKPTNKNSKYSESDSESDLELSSDNDSVNDNNDNTNNFNEDFEEDVYDDEYDEQEVDSPDEEGSDGIISDDDSDEDCVYKLTRTALDRETQTVTFVTVDEDIEKFKNDEKYIKPEHRITRPYLSKYEKTRIISERTIQMKSGSMVFIKDQPGSSLIARMTEREKAEMELTLKKCPIIIIRTRPDGKIELWDSNELEDLNIDDYTDSAAKVVEIE